ncbi:uncharacterized protein LOC119306974 isoform X1 [Triticum dicoccoides]|uniref:uncharacterized protein LOC119306974 isoform X1 n=2 Tax=Triticum dicoccoides TaxID=85692 RepID=UPI000E7B9AF5|nr:uncharacterized protein LOC119306974 isoform X1 [Triticum dicoccoides]
MCGTRLSYIKFLAPSLDMAFVTHELNITTDLLAVAARQQTGDGKELLRNYLKQIQDISFEFEDYQDNHLMVHLDEKSRRHIINLLVDQHNIARLKELRTKLEPLSKMLRRAFGKPASSPNAAALSYVAYDEYVLNGDCEATHAYDGIPLEQYKQINQILLEYNKDSMEHGVPVLPGEIVLPGETVLPTDYQIASELGKRIIRIILKSLRANELSSQCFTQFAESYILIVGSFGMVKLKNVSILRNLPADVLLERQRSNYMSAHNIILGLFSGNPPQGIRHLLDLIDVDFTPRELFHVHGSLVPVERYWSRLQNMYEYIQSHPPKAYITAILDSLPYVDTWKDRIKTNELLLIPFNYNPKSYQVPSDDPKQACLSKGQKAALEGIGVTPEPHQTPAQIKWIGALQLLKYLRNRTAHRMDAWEKWIEPKLAAKAQGSEVDTANLAYNAQGSDLVTYIRFPLIVPHMQVELYKRNEHHKIRMNELF